MSFFALEFSGRRGGCFPSPQTTCGFPASGRSRERFCSRSPGAVDISSLSVGTRNFSWPQTIENNQNRVGIVVPLG
jgi:hypothetical protein